MKHLLQLLGSYILIAAVAVFLYAPWFMGLSPSDPSLLNAGLSIILGVVLAGCFVGSTVHTVHALQGPSVKLLKAGEVNEVEDVRPILAALGRTEYVGDYARDALTQVESVDRKAARLEKAISEKFEAGSMTWEKFMSVVAAARQTVLKNAASLANKIQTFDTEGYSEARSSQPRSHYQSPEFNQARLKLYEDAQNEMRDILTANERLLLELARLEDELADLEDAGNREANTRMIEEVQTLVDETKYYQQ